MNQIAPVRTTGDLLLSEAARLLGTGAASAALPLLQAALQRLEGSAPAQGLMAEAHLQLADGPAALAAAEAALALAPDDPRLRLLRAQARRLCRDPAGAMQDACLVVEAMPHDAQARRVLATMLSEGGQHDEALFLFWGLVQEDGSCQRRRIDLALALSRSGRFEAAEELYALVRSESVETRGLGTPRVRNMLSAGDPGRALALAEDAAALEGPSGALHAARGQALMELGRRDEARQALESAMRLQPGDAFVAHLAAALGQADGEVHQGYARDLFDHYAPFFEASLISLNYRAPALVLRALEALRPGLADGSAPLGAVLDLGCGTGLLGVVVHDRLSDGLVGVDLSPRMLDQARAKGIYTALHLDEACHFLEAGTDRFDAVLAGDVLIYVADARRMLRGMARRLAPNGIAVFTCEAPPDGLDEAINAQGRFQHGEAFLRAALAAAGLEPCILRREALRLEAGEPVPGWIVAARHAP